MAFGVGGIAIRFDDDHSRGWLLDSVRYLTHCADKLLELRLAPDRDQAGFRPHRKVRCIPSEQDRSCERSRITLGVPFNGGGDDLLRRWLSECFVDGPQLVGVGSAVSRHRAFTSQGLRHQAGLSAAPHARALSAPRSRRSRPVISTLPSSVNCRRRTFRSATSSSRVRCR